MRTLARLPRGDGGASLIFALIFLTTFSVLTGALLALGQAALNSNREVYSIGSGNYPNGVSAANAAAQEAIELERIHQQDSPSDACAQPQVTETAATQTAGATDTVFCQPPRSAGPDFLTSNQAGSTTVTDTADVAITDVPSAPAIASDTPVTYTVTVTNTGPSEATNIAVTETLTPDTVIPALSSSPNLSCSASLLTPSPVARITCQIIPVGGLSAPLADGAPATMTATFDPSATGFVTSAAETTADGFDPNLANNSVTVATGVALANQALLAVDASPLPAQIPMNGSLTYTVTVTNLGPGTASGIEVTDTVSGTTATVTSSGPLALTCIPPGGVQVSTCTLSQPGLVARATTTAVITVAPSATGTVSSDVTVAAGNQALQAPDATGSTSVTDLASLSVTVAPSTATVAVSGTVTDTVTIRNNGLSAANDVGFTDTTTADVSPTVNLTAPAAFSPGCGGTDPVTCTANFGPLPAGGSVTATLSFSMPGPGAVTTTANASSDNLDPLSANGVTQSVSVLDTADLTTIVVPDVTQSALGGPVTYTVTLTNNGPEPATNVQLTDTVAPATLTPHASASSGGLTCTAAGTAGQVGCDSLTSLAAGATATATFWFTPTGPATVTDTATVIAGDLSPGSVPSAEASTSVIKTTTLAVSVAPSTSLPVAVGQTVSYTVTVTNTGLNAADGVSLTDSVSAGPSAGITQTSNSSGLTCRSPTNGSVGCTQPALGIGASVTLTVAVTPTAIPAAIDDIGITATNSTNTPSASDSIATADPGTAELALTSQPLPTIVDLGGTTTYLLTVTNQGPAVASGIVVTDTVTDTVSAADVTPGTDPDSHFTCSDSPGTFACTDPGTLSPGEFAEVTVTVTPQTAGVLEVANSASVFAAGNSQRMFTFCVAGVGTPAATSINACQSQGSSALLHVAVLFERELRAEVITHVSVTGRDSPHQDVLTQ